jgi:predicted exporter
MNRAKWFLLLAVVLVALTAWKIEVHTNISDFFFPGDKADSRFLAGQLQSDELSRQYLISITQSPPESENLDDFIQSLRKSLQNIPAIKHIESDQIDEETLLELVAFYQPHRIHLFSLEPEHAFAEIFGSEGLANQAMIIEEALLGPDSATVKSAIKQDPMLLTLSWLAKLKPFSSPEDNQQAYANLRINTHPSGLDAAAQEAFQQQLQDVFDAVNEKYSRKFSLQYTGVPVFATHIKKQITRDIQAISTLSMIALTALFLWIFRSLRALISTSIVLLVTISAASLATQLFFGFIHGLTLALGITLVGVCVDYVIHGMVHAADKQGAERVLSFRRIWPSLLLGGITTIIGYTAISLSGFPGLQQIALFAAVGIVTTLLITRYILPELMDLFAFTVQPRFSANWLLNALQGRGPKLLAFGVALIFITTGIQHLEWGSNLNELTPELKQLQERDKILRSRVASIEPGRFVLVEGENIEQTLQTSEQVHVALLAVQNKGQLSNFYSLYPWLGSHTLQTRNTQAWTASLTAKNKQRWLQALEEQGLSSASFPPLTTSNAAPLTLEKLQSSPAWPLISRQISENPAGGFSVAIWLGKHAPNAIRDALNKIPQAHYFSQQESINSLALEYRQKALSLLGWGFLTILTLLSLRFRSIIRAIQVLLPATLSVLIILGAWGMSEAPMNMLHLIGLLLTTAICVDYGIFYAENRSGDQALTFQAILISALTSALSFACLGVADSPALHALAWTVAPGVILGFLLCPIMLTSDAKIRQC